MNHTLAGPLKELRTLIKKRLADSRNRIGINIAAMKAVSRNANDRKNAYTISDEPATDIWAGLGLGSDVAAALQSRSNKRRKRE